MSKSFTPAPTKMYSLIALVVWARQREKNLKLRSRAFIEFKKRILNSINEL